MATSIPKAVPKSIPRAVPPTPEPAPAPVKKSGKKLFLIIGAVLLLLSISGGAWYYYGADGNAAADGSKSQRAAPPVFVVLEQFTVNLQPEGGEQFLQVAFTLQVGSQTDVEQIKVYMPEVRSRLVLMLSSQKASELLTIEGKKKLAEDIISQIKLPFHPQVAPLEISNVFFTSFVIQ